MGKSGTQPANGKPTIRDVASRANVSIKTVSNVVRGDEARVGAPTRERVRKAIDELGYRPNPAARHLRNAKVGILALALPSLDHPALAMIASAIVDAGSAAGYTVLIDPTGGRLDNELAVANGLRPHLIDGIILSPVALIGDHFREISPSLPMVLLGERLLEVSFDHVLIDSVAAARLATEHLIDTGRQRIAAVGMPRNPVDLMPHARLEGYVRAVEEAGLEVDSDLIATLPGQTFRRDDGMAAMRELLALPTPPDALVCFNDLVALGAMRVAIAAGCRVPDDIAFVGIDNIEEGRFAMPALTTIAPDYHAFAEIAVSTLIRQVEGDYERTRTLRHVPFELIVRESSAGRAS